LYTSVNVTLVHVGECYTCTRRWMLHLYTL